MSSTTRLICLLVLACLVSCGRGPQPAEPGAPTGQDSPPATAAARRLVIGDVDANDPVRKFEWFKPFADHLAAKLAAFGIDQGDVRIAPNMETMISWLTAGEVDLYLDSLYPAMVVAEQSGAMPFLRRWKGGVSEYHSVFLTTANSGVQSVEDLNGRILALDDEASTSGFFLPVAYLRSLGLKLRHYGSFDAVPPADRIGYTFTGDDENTVQWLLSGRVAGAAIDSITLLRDVSDEARAGFVVLAKTDPVPRQVILARSDLDPELLTELTALLLGLPETAAGRAALESIDTTRFDRFPEGPEAALAQMHTDYAAFREWLER